MIVKWGHFSDLHFKDWGGFKTNILKKKLPDALKRDKIKFDYMFITGDIFNQGIFDEKIKDFIGDIASIAGCNKENIIICPGNHDGERHEIRKLTLDSFISKRIDSPNVEMDKKYYNTLVTQPFDAFAKSHEDITGRKPESILHYVRKLENINLYVLNTAIFAGQTYPEGDWTGEEIAKDDRNLYICDSKLFELDRRAKEQGFSDKDLTLVLGHHGVECFTDEEQKGLKTFFDDQKVDLYLCGHVHTNTNKEIDETMGIRQVSCGGMFSDDYSEASFIVGEFDSNNCSVTLTNYAFDNKPQWMKNTAARSPYDFGIHLYTPTRFSNRESVSTTSTKSEKSLYDTVRQQYDQIDSTPSKSIINAIKRDVIVANDTFCGYATELKELKSAMTHNGYVYVHGEQLFGKTHLILKSIYDISTQDEFSVDFSVNPIPWIHKCFVVIGKKVSSKDRGFEVLIEQANAVLSEPVHLETKDYDKYGFRSIMQKLSNALEHVTVIFDALDEMGMDDLELFTEPLPNNCTVILSSKTKRSKQKNDIENPKFIELCGFSEKDVLEIIGLNKRERNVTGFVTFLMNQTNGNPCFILDIAKSIQDNNNEIPEDYRKAYKYIDSLKNFFAKFKEIWMAELILEDMLKIFVIFECVDYLTTERIQSYLSSAEKQVHSDRVEQAFKKVMHQLDTDDNGGYKLKYNAFVWYVIEKYTVADFEMVFSSISNWLISEKKYDSLAWLFLNWNLQDNIGDAKIEIMNSQNNKILDALIEGKASINLSLIQALCVLAKNHKELQMRFHLYIVKLFNGLERKEDYDVVSAYFTYLYDTSETGETKKEAVNYIKTLADKGNKSAALWYAELIVYGDIYVEKNIDLAIHYFKIAGENLKSVGMLYNIYREEKEDKILRNKYLDKLIKYDDKSTQIVYASCLAEGYVYEKDVRKSCEIFDQLISENYSDAIIHKADLIISGILDNCSIEEAFELWDKASNQDPRGYFKKGEYLYNNNEQQKGYNLIKQAYMKGSISASLFIAQYNLDHNIKFNTDLVHKLNQLVEVPNERNREAAALIYAGIKEQLIKKYTKYDLGNLYYLAYNVLSTDKAYEYYDVKDYENAFLELAKVLNSGDLNVVNDMAYMLRRGDANSDIYTVKELLTPFVKDNNPLAIVNYVLEIIENVSEQQIFDEALDLLKKLDTSNADYKNVISWWQQLSNQNDPEGDLVLGMLMYVDKLDKDSDVKDMKMRLQTAKAAGYEIADYILQPLDI